MELRELIITAVRPLLLSYARSVRAVAVNFFFFLKRKRLLPLNYFYDGYCNTLAFLPLVAASI